MLKVYLDRGAKSNHQHDIVSVGCVIFKEQPYKQFVRPWNRMLKQWQANVFHATDFYNGANEFKRDNAHQQRLFAEHSRIIPHMIGSSAYRIFFVSFRPSEFIKTVPADWIKKFGSSIHSQAVQLIMIANGHWREKRCKHEYFAYFIETGDPDQAEVTDTMNHMKDDRTGTGEVVRIKSVNAVSKGVARGTEAADFVAWHWNKYYMDKVTKDKEDPRKDFAALVNSHKNRIGYIFATGDKLKYLFSLISTNQTQINDSPNVKNGK